MKTIRIVLALLILILGVFVAIYGLLHAQEAATLTQSGEVLLTATNAVSAMSDLEVEMQAIEMTTPLPASNAPDAGNFYSTQHAPGSAEEWPPLPADVLKLPVWPLGDDFYLLDDLNVNYNALQAQSLSANGGMKAMTDFAPLDLVASTNLWLEITNLANNTAYLLLSNTIADVQYEIQATTNLSSTNWVFVGTVLGSEITNWTPASVAATTYPNLFLRVRSDIDSDNIGIPDWWQLQYFGYVGIDPNGDPMGDGWSNAQKYEYGMNPNVFYTPPTPQGLTVIYNASAKTAAVSWLPSPVPVTGYTVTNSDGVSFYFSAGTESFTDNLSADVPNGYFIGDPTIYKTYQVQAHYPDGSSAWSAPVSLEFSNSVSAAFVPSQTNVYLAVSVLPTGTTAIRLTRIDEDAMSEYGNTSYNTNWNIPVGNFTNGIYSIPASWTPVLDGYGFGDYAWFLQTVSANGNVSTAVFVENDANYWVDGGVEATLNWPAPFFDGRAQLKQNLIFQLRAATVDFPFEYSGGTSNPVTYVCAGFDQVDAGNPYQSWIFEQYKPAEDNYLYRNFVFNLSELDSTGRTTTGAGGDYSAGGLTLSGTPLYQFQPPATFSNTLPTLLATNNTQWLCSYAFDSDPGYLGEIGITNIAVTYYMASNARNYWGLPFVSAKIGYGSGLAATLSAGGNTTQAGYFYPDTAQPQFQTAEYDFWIPELDWLPGQSGFAVTNKSRLMVTGVGTSYVSGNAGNGVFNVAAYAKLSVQNAYSGAYGYLQQYFDKAYQIDTNGIVTTNTTGILSPYGDFFATQPGPVELVTMPDLDTGARGTCTVYCVSLQLDANHDGTMNTSFGGPDQTSPNNPYVFWCNNNFDRWHSVDGDDNEQDDLEVAYGYNNGLAYPMPDCNFTVGGSRQIPCTRDLEDFSRLWINGVTSNLLAALPSGSTVLATRS